MQLTLLDWSPDGRRLLFCTAAGDCHSIDAGGNPVSKVPLHCKASIYTLCSAMIALRIWDATPTHLHCPTPTLQDDVYRTGACASDDCMGCSKSGMQCSFQPPAKAYATTLW